MQKFLFCFILVVPLWLFSCNNKEKETSLDATAQWTLVYRNDKNGNPIYGDKQDLINAVRKGYPIRVGWSSRRALDTTKSVEHVSDATFITIANQDHVFVQIEPFLAQRPNLTSDTLGMTPMPVQLSWLLGTNGTISSLDIHYTTNTSKTNPSRLFGRGLSWFVFGSPNNASESQKTIPLWD